MYKIFYDSEFTALHQDTTALSMGFVTEDDNAFYCEFDDHSKSMVSQWVKDNVYPNLVRNSGDVDGLFKALDFLNITMFLGNKQLITLQFNKWLQSLKITDSIQMVSDIYTYDWLLFTELVRTQKTDVPDFPHKINFYPLDLNTLFFCKGLDARIDREKFIGVDAKLKHNSLWDAYVIKQCWEKLIG